MDAAERLRAYPSIMGGRQWGSHASAAGEGELKEQPEEDEQDQPGHGTLEQVGGLWTWAEVSVSCPFPPPPLPWWDGIRQGRRGVARV